jgi:hypothetical protein
MYTNKTINSSGSNQNMPWDMTKIVLAEPLPAHTIFKLYYSSKVVEIGNLCTLKELRIKNAGP